MNQDHEDLKGGGFVVKGGTQVMIAGGMVRSTSEGKVDYTLAMDGVMFKRWAAHLTRATEPPASYPKRNWLLARKEPDVEKRQQVMERAQESAMRHMYQWLSGNRDEDHAAAVMFNINVAETLRATL